MFSFLLGVAVGAIGAIWYQQSGMSSSMSMNTLEGRFGELQDRANAVLSEARRVLQETRSELQTVIETSRQSVQEKVERVRQAAESPSTDSGGPSSET